MARTWLSVRVELLGGRGEDLWPWPGRIFAVAPSHTFLDLAEAIDDAFARWDRSHLSVFTLADGRVITDDETGQELVSNSFGPIVAAVDIESAKVGRMLTLGATFQYTFDLGDNWVHRCVVGERKIDPLDEVGIVPDKPLPYWGWGSIPDQYGRNWDGDDGESRMPQRPRAVDPMQAHEWPAVGAVAELDIRAVRAAVAAADAVGFLDALTGREIDDALQQVGSGMAMALRSRRRQAEPVVLSLIHRLTGRSGPGDQVLADDLLALLRRESPAAHTSPVDLDELSSFLEGDFGESSTVYVDVLTGEAFSGDFTDPAIVGEDAAMNVEAEPDRWVRLERAGSRDRWEDMEAFVLRQRDSALRDRLIRAIEGAGAFRRFRDLVHDEGLAEQWQIYSDDRRWGRARDALADAGIRVF
ncbi:IS1096 element passenger TnpR family protein [Microbacterium sp. NPDC055357]